MLLHFEDEAVFAEQLARAITVRVLSADDDRLHLVNAVCAALYRREKSGVGQRIDVPAFKAFFDLLTVQRKLKDAGRFEFIHRVKSNENLPILTSCCPGWGLRGSTVLPR